MTFRSWLVSDGAFLPDDKFVTFTRKSGVSSLYVRAASKHTLRRGNTELSDEFSEASQQQ
jgi:hypothetical protein